MVNFVRKVFCEAVLARIKQPTKGDCLMKKVSVNILAGICFITAVLWIGTSVGAEDNGKDLYTSKCQLCHGVKGDGKGSGAAYLGAQPADFTSHQFWETHTEKDISDAIQNGRGEMPAFDFKPDELKAIIDYITHTFKPEKK
jgi:cytochrome c5